MSVATTPFKSAGTTLGFKAGGSSTFDNLAQLVDMEESGVATDDIETTTLASTIKSYIPSIPDPGEVTFTIYNVPGDASVAAIKAMANAPAVVMWQVQYSDGSSPTTGTTETFSGYVNSFAAKGFAQGDTPTADVSIKISGLITTALGT